ncbi:nuclear transport factor 2 family protein [Tritonibacter scottomollicae]|uniref:nuclear transport factor 2 family protein n=1 Tax=Tritonibacter scottomollicae TaxID=483013 RepID=UPI003AA86DF8
MDDLTNRSTREVFEDHLQLAQEGSFEEDIKRNFSKECVVLTNRGAFCGHDGLRQLADMLQREIPDAAYGYINRLVEDRFALLEWTADCGTVAVYDGADSFVVENGKVVAQTIHYTLSVRDPQSLTNRAAS